MQQTSLEALQSVRPTNPATRESILQAIRNAGGSGLTCDQVEAISYGAHQNVSARINELARAGKIKDSGYRRKTRSGRNAIVWIEGDGIPQPKWNDSSELNALKDQVCELLLLIDGCASWHTISSKAAQLEDAVGYADWCEARND